MAHLPLAPTFEAHPYVQSVIKQCAKEGIKVSMDHFADKVKEPTFLDQLETGLNRWTREIQKVTKLDRDPSSGTAQQEISFWVNLQQALLRLQEQCQSAAVDTTLEILKNGKRFHATVSFNTDTGLKEALDIVDNYGPLMKDFPLNDLLAATNFGHIQLALKGVFVHFKKIRNTKYPMQRALQLVEAISRDLMSQMVKVLGTRRMMHMPFAEFEQLLAACSQVFHVWDDEYDKFQTLLRELIKKKRDEHLKMVWRINCAHRKLQIRLANIRQFRTSHEQLWAAIFHILRPLSMDADINEMNELYLAYESVKDVDVLNLTTAGSSTWDASTERYTERIGRIEGRLADKLHHQLDTAKDANEMFLIFSRFTALLDRPGIVSGSIRQYQAQLLEQVNIEALKEKFKEQSALSKDGDTSTVDDLPLVSGSIIWRQELERELNECMRRVEDILGKSWENHTEGQKLKSDADSLRMKLNTQSIFDEWTRKVGQRELTLPGPTILSITSPAPSQSASGCKLRVNFTPDLLTLAAEVPLLRSRGFRVPLGMLNKVKQASQHLPSALSLIDTVKAYARACEKIEKKPSLVPLLADLKLDVEERILEGSTMVWESGKRDSYVQRLGEAVSNFERKSRTLLAIVEQIDLHVQAIENSSHSFTVFCEHLSVIKESLDKLKVADSGYSHLPEFVRRLEEEVETKLAFRLPTGISARTSTSQGNDQPDDSDTEDLTSRVANLCVIQ